jgi:hypothetical protein
MGMPTYWTGEVIRPGQWVKVWVKAFGGTMHDGIVRSVTKANNGFIIEVVHNAKDRGVIVSDWVEFSEGGLVHLHRKPDSDDHARFILANARVNIGKEYRTSSQNCQHFCWFCYTLEKKSETVEVVGWMLLGTAAGLAFFLPDSR